MKQTIYYVTAQTETSTARFYSESLCEAFVFASDFHECYRDEKHEIRILNSITGELLAEFENKRFMTGWKQSEWVTDSIAEYF